MDAWKFKKLNHVQKKAIVKWLVKKGFVLQESTSDFTEESDAESGCYLSSKVDESEYEEVDIETKQAIKEERESREDTPAYFAKICKIKRLSIKLENDRATKSQAEADH